MTHRHRHTHTGLQELEWGVVLCLLYNLQMVVLLAKGPPSASVETEPSAAANELQHF